ncbi:MAG: tRNA lysidine(34) synthetase TilS, partial [Dehalococcoidales bacterium]|nr:tRNA lysidine(34) synthetase TilS [Dehalococcoidales bacterium]
VAHLDHQLRGAESAADAQYVAQLAKQLGIPATLDQRDVKDYQARQHISLEEAAREVRYTFLAEVARSIGTDRVAVGHTTDDNIETILMHLIRGAGTRGLRGLQPGSQWQSAGASLTIVRPLLRVSRQETADYCHDHQLRPRLDSSNLSLLPLRNRIRQQLLPLLQSYNPRVTEALLRTAHIAGDDLAFLEQEGARLWTGIAQRQGDSIILSKASFLDLPAALQRHLLRMAIAELLGNLKDIETRHIEEIMAILTKSAGKKFSLPGGLVFTIEYQQFRLSLDTEPLSPFPVLDNEFVLKIPGETRLPGWRVQASIVAPSVAHGNPDGTDASSETITRTTLEKGIRLGSQITAYIDRDKAGAQVLVRCRQPGDRLQPLGMSQPKTLGEFMIDAKIPRNWRQGIPIVCSHQQILWVVGWRIDDRVKVTRDTRAALCLKFERTDDTLNQTVPPV